MTRVYCNSLLTMCIYKHVHVFSITSAVLTTDIDSIQHTIIYLTEMK